MEDNTDSPSKNNPSINPECNIRNIFIGLKCIMQNAAASVRARIFSRTLINDMLDLGGNLLALITTCMFFAHIPYWIGLAKVKLFGVDKGYINTESLPMYRFGADAETAIAISQVITEGDYIILYTVFGVILILILVFIGTIVHMITSEICKIGQEHNTHHERKK